MKNTSTYNALIDKLNALYFEYALALLHKRMAGYHRIASHQKHADDIKAPLLEYVDVIIASCRDNPEVTHNPKHITVKTNNPYSKFIEYPETAQTIDYPIVRNTVDREHVANLSKYFKARVRGAGLNPGIEEKLKHSVWDHIHAALRCARQANKQNAKMHIDIANCACRELAHYLSKEPYYVFIANIEKHLAELDLLNKTKGS